MASEPSAPPDPKEEGVHPRDMSQYIRTYAKDMAQLTGQPTPTVPAQKDAEPQDVSLPEIDPSPVQHSEPSSPKEFPQETIDVPKVERADIFEQKKDVAPAPPPQPEEAERQAVLERLRAKVAAGQKAAEALPAPEPILPLPPEPPPPPAPPPLPKPVPPAQPEASPLHTYTSDFADRIDEKQASTISVLAAEQDRTDRPRTKEKKSSILPITLAVLLIVLGIGGLGAAFYLTAGDRLPQETLGVPSLIFADEKMELAGPDYRQNLADAAGQPLVEGNVLITYTTMATTTQLGVRNEPQPGGVLMRSLDLGAPDILLRNVDISSTVGIIAAGGETRPFFLMRVNSFERTFAGMLGWEPRMRQDLIDLYPPYAQLTTETDPLSTSTPATAPVSTPSGQFTDAIVANRDVRILRDGLGRSLIVYGYADKQTLIIARNEAAFTALVARIAAAAGQ